MDSSKPDPLFSSPQLGTVCPVCGKKSYSPAGIHPQCAVKQADAPREAQLAVKKKEARLAAAVALAIDGPKQRSAMNPGKPR